MPAILYTTLSATPYVSPPNPGTQAAPGQNASAATIEQDRIRHLEQRRVHDNHMNMDSALKTLLIDATEDVFLHEVRNKYTGYLGVTTRDLLDHLLDRYGKITAADIEECKRRMTSPMDIDQSIDRFFERIDDCVQYAADGSVAFTNEQILQTAYHVISTSGY